MKQTLLNKYMKGESSASEERKLLDLLLETPQNQLSQDQRAVLELLSYAEQEDEEDIFAVDYFTEYDAKIQSDQSQAKMVDAEIVTMSKDVELKPKIQWIRYISIAASIIIICTFAFTLQLFDENKQKETASENANLVLTDEDVNSYLAEVAGAGYYTDRHSIDAANIVNDIKQREAYLHSQIK